MEMVRTEGLSFSYENREILNGIDFHSESGEITAILGPNGCGKTTLLDCIIGFIKPERGEVFIREKNLQSLSIKEIAREVAYIPQKTSPAFSFSVIEMAVSGRVAHLGIFSSPGEKDYAIAERSLMETGIWHLRDRTYGTLSGGEAQLAIIARALSQETDILIMDEPTAYLDFNNSYMVIDIIIHIVREFGKSVIFTTQNPNEIFYINRSGLKTKSLMLKNSRIFRSGPAKKVMTKENLKELFGRECIIIGDNNSGHSLVPFIQGG
jgi:iron complex transport system ATP-binding protein